MTANLGISEWNLRQEHEGPSTGAQRFCNLSLRPGPSRAKDPNCEWPETSGQAAARAGPVPGCQAALKSLPL